MLRKLGRARVAVMTGWAVDSSCRYRYGADAAFPLSDHADFDDLIEFVKQVQPRKVFTLHGFAADFAQRLRELGFDAEALSEEEQMPLGLGFDATPIKPAGASPVIASPQVTDYSDAIHPEIPNAFIRLAKTSLAIAATSSKIGKTRLLAEYLRSIEPPLIPTVVTWFTGTPFAPTENKVMQLGWATLRDAIGTVGGVTESDFHQVYLKHSDLGETAFEIFSHRPAVVPFLSIESIAAAFAKLQAARGALTKLPLLIQVLEQCCPLEAKFFIKILTSDLRIGLKEGLVEEAVAQAFNVGADEVRQANLLLGNIGETAQLAQQNRLTEASLVPFRPVKFMLASPEPTAANVWKRIEALHATGAIVPNEAVVPLTVRVEDKYDGIRCQLHKVGERVALYSRDLKEITTTFPEVADAARQIGRDVILDGEILAMRGDDVLPFAHLQRRLGRREPDLFMRDEFPIKYVAFDLLWRDGQTMLARPLQERWEALLALQPLPEAFRLAKVNVAHSPEQIDAAFAAARARNNEGLMIKDPQSAYTPGRRGLSWLKLKMAFDTLDCVVVGAEYGHGKRRNVLSDYTFAVRDEDSGQLKTIGKAYSGLTDTEIAELTEHFLNRVVREYGRYHEVMPDTVLEIAFDRLQASSRHSSGLAMRFPRILRIRRDKTPDQIDTVQSARRLVRQPNDG
jgi:DNA ligase-1